MVLVTPQIVYMTPATALVREDKILQITIYYYITLLLLKLIL